MSRVRDPDEFRGCTASYKIFEEDSNVTMMMVDTKSRHKKRENKSEPERTCVGSREAHAPTELVRLIVLPLALSPWDSVAREGEGETIAIDVARRAPGRGAWILPTKDAISAAFKKGGFHRAFKRRLKLPTEEEFVEAIGRYLSEGIEDSIRLARRAGALAIGESSVATSMKNNRCRLLIVADDISEGNRRKFQSNAERKGIDFIVGPDGHQLGPLVGSEVCRLLGVQREPFATRIHRSIRHWRAFERAPGDVPSNKDI